MLSRPFASARFSSRPSAKSSTTQTSLQLSPSTFQSGCRRRLPWKAASVTLSRSLNLVNAALPSSQCLLEQPIAETDYRRACDAAMAHSEPPRQISKQMFHLFPKIREVDAVMTPALQQRVFECHPELAFWTMNGRAAPHEPKKLKGREHLPGLEQRRALLSAQGYDEAFLRDQHAPRSKAGPDDFLDACACAWTAARILRGEAIRFPPDPPLDAKGLRMEILAYFLTMRIRSNHYAMVRTIRMMSSKPVPDAQSIAIASCRCLSSTASQH